MSTGPKEDPVEFGGRLQDDDGRRAVFVGEGTLNASGIAALREDEMLHEKRLAYSEMARMQSLNTLAMYIFGGVAIVALALYTYLAVRDSIPNNVTIGILLLASAFAGIGLMLYGTVRARTLRHLGHFPILLEMLENDDEDDDRHSLETHEKSVSGGNYRLVEKHAGGSGVVMHHKVASKPVKRWIGRRPRG